MRNFKVKALAMAMALLMTALLFTSCGAQNASQPSDVSGGSQSSSGAGADAQTTAEKPIEFSMSYYDNPTYPFNPDWLPLVEAQKLCNAKINVQAYPMSDYKNKITVALNTGSAPDLLLNIDASINPYASYGLNGALVAINKYESVMTNFKGLIEQFELQEDIKDCKASDGNLYFMPRIADKPIYNAGLLIRTDLLEEYGLKAPTTFEELYDVLKVFKAKNPSSYPLTIYQRPYYLFDFSMPPFGVSLGEDSDSGSYVLSYDREKNEYFTAAVSDRFKEYLKYFSRLYSEGLIDPELINPSDKWTSKLATGKSMASYGWYDQIGGIITNRSTEKMSFDMLPPLKGPYGAHTLSAKRLNAGGAISGTAAKRPDFERLVQTIDKFFYSPEMVKLFSQGKEGASFDLVDGKVQYKDKYVNDPNGLFKALQINFGLGTVNTQMVWIKSDELLKKDTHYTEINNAVDQMEDGIPPKPPLPKFTDAEAEEVGLLLAPLSDMFEVWTNSFITGLKSVDKDWDEYVAEAKSKNIDKLAELYNEVLKRNQ